MRKIIAIINQKGGVGKTTSSINLSCGLAMKEVKTLLIDLDPQAHSTLGLGVEPGSYSTSVSDVFLKEKRLTDVVLKTEVDNLYIVPSSLRLDMVEQQLTSEMFRESCLTRAIGVLGNTFDFIILDCRPTLGILTVNALYACNFIIVPCEMSRYALEGFADLLKVIDVVKNGTVFNKDTDLKILLTKYDIRNKVTNEWIMDQLRPYRRNIFKTIIRRNESINQAHIAQKPVLTFKANSAGAEDYMALTMELINYVD